MKKILNTKQLEYLYLQKDIRGINPKVSTYKVIETQIQKLAEELGYKSIRKVVAPQWNKDVPVDNVIQRVHGDPNVLVKGAVFVTHKNRRWNENKQQSQ